MKLFPLSIIALLSVAPLLGGCGEDLACPEEEGEIHLDQQMTDPGMLSVMLHQVSQACSSVGENSYHAYYIEDGEMHMKPATTGGLDISSVSAFMPEHGHGSTEDPSVDASDSSYFAVNYQMAGTWEVTLELTVPEVSDDPQTVTFTLDVSE